MGCYAWFNGNPQPFYIDECIKWATETFNKENNLLKECYEFVCTNNITHPIFTELQVLLDTEQFEKIEKEYSVFYEFIGVIMNYNSSKINQKGLEIFKEYYENILLHNNDIIEVYYDRYIEQKYNIEPSYIDIEKGLFYTELDIMPFRVYNYPEDIIKTKEQCIEFMSNTENGIHKVLFIQENNEYFNIESTDKERYLKYLPKVIDDLYNKYPDVIIDFG